MSKFTKLMPRGGWAGLLVAAIGFLLMLPFGEWAVRLSYDLPFLPAHQNREDLVMVYINPESKRALGLPAYQPLPLSYHAKALDHMRLGGARLVFYDLIFDTNNCGETARDVEEFAAAIARHKMVLLAADYSEKYVNGALIQRLGRSPEPLERAAAGWGLDMVGRPDPDFGQRQITTGFGANPSASWKAAELLGAEVTKNPANREALNGKWLNYYCAPNELPHFNFDQVYSNSVPAGTFSNKVVIVCASPGVDVAGAQRDEFANPFSRFGAPFSSGGQIHAISLLNLQHEDWLVRAPWFIEMVLVVGVGLVLGAGLSRLSVVKAVCLGIGISIVITVLAFVVVWWKQFWFPWFIVAGVQAPAAVVWAIAANALRSHLALKSVQGYFGPKRSKQLLREQPQLIDQEAAEQKVSMIFTDIADFSSISAGVDAKDLIFALKGYYEKTIQCVFDQEGTVMDIIGDAIFAIWNAPEPQKDYLKKAAETALLLQATIVEFDKKITGMPPLRTRVGVHSGEVSIGNIGSAQRFDYAAIGKNVNLASRLEGLNKYLQTEILATREIQREIAGVAPTRLVGFFAFKGFEDPVRVYELLDPKKVPVDAPWLKTFDAGMDALLRKNFAEADDLFAEVLKVRENDGPSKYCRKMIPLVKDSDKPLVKFPLLEK